MTQSTSQPAVNIADAIRSIRHVFITNLTLDALIGVYEHEKINPQKIVINIDLTVSEDKLDIDDKLIGVVCYETIVNKIKTILAAGHVNLVETLAEQFADACLEDSRVIAARVRLEKPEAISEAASVGIEIERSNLRS
jgi:7,8-dihydroneopterin aldolase/epimerase/oxygenase